MTKMLELTLAKAAALPEAALAAATMNFVSGFDASATGGAISTIGFTTQALSSGATVASTAQEPAITDTTTIGQLQTLVLTDTSTNTLAYRADQVPTHRRWRTLPAIRSRSRPFRSTEPRR
jgi:hypothetical protein